MLGEESKATQPAQLSSTCEESLALQALEHNNQKPSVQGSMFISCSEAVASCTRQQNNIKLEEGIESIAGPAGDCVFSSELLAGALGEYRYVDKWLIR